MSHSLPLSEFVKVRQSGVRSIHIEHDLLHPEIMGNYLLTSQGESSLNRIIGRMFSVPSTRAWTLTGPYGSGKSFFSLFLFDLLCVSNPGHAASLQLLAKVDERLCDGLRSNILQSDSNGLLPVPVTGFRAPFQDCIRHGLEQALLPLAQHPSISSAIEELQQWTGGTDSRAITRWFQRLTTSLSTLPSPYRGLMLIFDEMGKPLEFAASHPELSDVYLLQELAEFANRSGQNPFIFVGVLHQAFERYATLLDGNTQREWSKVQGRYEDIPFQEPPSQQMRLVIKALEHTNPQMAAASRATLTQLARACEQANWRPPLLSQEDFVTLCADAYPLHPSALVTLPVIFRKLAQNERSVFAYLGMLEPRGFQEFLKSNTFPELIGLPDLFDYLTANFEARLYASGRARAVTEALERLNNSHRFDDLEAKLVKSIGLLNWLSEVSHLQASQETLCAALRSPEVDDEAIRVALTKLQTRSVIVFRRYNRTYVMWQGSDVNIDERLDQAEQQLSGAFSIAEIIQKFLPPRPMVARRHSFLKGSTRFFEVAYMDMLNRDTLALDAAGFASGKVLLCLPYRPTDADDFRNWATLPEVAGRTNLILGIPNRIARLNELVHELRCLNWVRENTPELADDPVARKELRTRLGAVETLLQSELDRSISLHRLSGGAGCQWYCGGQEVLGKNGEGLSHQLSTLCDNLYTSSPQIWNELINRQTLSSQAAAARRNLIEAMLTNASLPVLGIEGFPPERSMYESLLHSSGLHGQDQTGNWVFSEPDKSSPSKLSPSWRAISEFIFTPLPEPRPLTELFALLSVPPFGITAGVFPILLCAFLQVHQHETTLYREGTLLVEPGMADWEVLLRRPELFAVAGCRVEGARKIILDRFSKAYHTEVAAMPVVRSLISQIRKGLPEFAQRTRNLPKEALAVRDAGEFARSPEHFLFVDLPLAVGCEPFDDRTVDPHAVELFFERLSAALTALSSALPTLRAWARDQFLAACELPEGEVGWQQFLELATEMAPRTNNPQLAPLLKRAAEAADARAALESVLAVIANRPLRSWTDSERERFPSQAHYMGEALRKERWMAHPEQALPPVLAAKADQLAAELRRSLNERSNDDPRIAAAALKQLLAEYERLSNL